MNNLVIINEETHTLLSLNDLTFHLLCISRKWDACLRVSVATMWLLDRVERIGGDIIHREDEGTPERFG